MILVDPIRDTTDRLSWGWISILYDVRDGQWIRTDRASELSGLSPAALRRWANRGVISQITGEKKAHRSYLRPELDVICCITSQITNQVEPPSLRAVKAHLEDVIYNGFR